MKYGIGIASLVLLLAGPASAQSGWTLVWSDEFNGAANTPPDTTKWDYDVGGGGWGNGEAEVYTASLSNAFQDGNGNLVIRAIKDAQGNYTSARLQTGAPGASTNTADNKWQYGRIEARIKLPPGGKGIWPAFWMLGEDILTSPWPACGEVDIMENFGALNNNSTINNGTVHGPGYSGANGIGASVSLPFGETVFDDYHLYVIEWSPNEIDFYVDGPPSYHIVTPAQIPSGANWVYNNPFYLLLNFAIGGPNTFLGTPDASVVFPQDMLVDYVRVYQATSVTATTPVITPGRIINAASFLGAIAPGGLAAVYGSNMADGVHYIAPAGVGQSFPTSVANVSVTVNGVAAALTYVSPTQINFQVPWETPTGANGLAVPVVVTWNQTPSNPEYVTVSAPSAPSLFLSEFVNGVAFVTGNPDEGCPTPTSECAVKPSFTYSLWANALGPKTTAQVDGMPSDGGYQVTGGASSCTMTVGGQPATVAYCGTAPDEIIDYIAFVYPQGVVSANPYVGATLTVNGVTSHFRVPAPAAANAAKTKH